MGVTTFGPELTDKYCANAKLELEIGRLAVLGVRRDRIAERLNVSPKAVFAALDRMGFAPPPKKKQKKAPLRKPKRPRSRSSDRIPLGKHKTCGTESGYQYHRRWSRDQACVACCDAHAEAERTRAQRKKAA